MLAMFCLNSPDALEGILYYLREYYLEIFWGILFSTGLFKNFELGSKRADHLIIYGVLFILSVMVLITGSFNPFIYFRF